MALISVTKEGNTETRTVTRIIDGNNMDNFTKLTNAIKAADNVKQYQQAKAAVEAAAGKVTALEAKIQALQNELDEDNKSSLVNNLKAKRVALENAKQDLETAKNELQAAATKKENIEDKVATAETTVNALKKINLSKLDTVTKLDQLTPLSTDQTDTTNTDGTNTNTTNTDTTTGGTTTTGGATTTGGTTTTGGAPADEPATDDAGPTVVATTGTGTGLQGAAGGDVVNLLAAGGDDAAGGAGVGTGNPGVAGVGAGNAGGNAGAGVGNDNAGQGGNDAEGNQQIIADIPDQGPALAAEPEGVKASEDNKPKVTATIGEGDVAKAAGVEETDPNYWWVLALTFLALMGLLGKKYYDSHKESEKN